MSFTTYSISLTRSGFDILRAVNLSINSGEITVIVGPNGAGKSSFVRVLSGDLTPTCGRIIFNGKDLIEWRSEQRAKMISVLPQHSSLDFPFNAYEVVSLGRIPHQSGIVRDAEIVREALKAVDAEHLDGRLFTKMSGGEKQRVQLARVMAQIWEPTSIGEQFLVLDEPTSALDLSHQVLVMRLVCDLAQRGIGVIIVSHDLNLATRFADNVIIFNKGSVVAEGAPNEILSEKLISDVFGIHPCVFKHPETGRNIVINW
ncbi:MAG: heme ABC transporter ATP-binding protein [Cellvibrionales bacterium TMED49]|nr:heme ABC transporter ATP-binding protein [Porticoccaceae bacterium]OUU40108.1 MAG: heme ABC transporter ATP-binding protein [Cellvibrionales bacterium TMED49]|tara:strand:- start:66 stop:842 length:777 start_codon:yes stop_codon:yes gene_type:complete